MTTDLRERALGAAFAVLAAIPGVTARRLPTFEPSLKDLPSVTMLDGADNVTANAGGMLLMRTEFLAIVSVKAASDDAVSTEVNALFAKVRAALGANRTLGGAAEAVLYAGCETPEPLAQDGSGPYAALAAHFVIQRTEAELDPYSAFPTFP